MNDEDRKNLIEILKALKITQVICIDDKYSDAPDINIVKATFIKMTKQQIKQIPDENIKTFSEIDEPDIRVDKFIKLWKKYDRKIQMELFSALKSIGENEDIEKTEFLSNLSKLFSGYPFKEMSPETWGKVSKSIIKKVDENNKVMLLFDMDLSHGGGTKTGGINEIIKVQNNDNILCGLITHKNDISDENDQWNIISEEDNLSKHKFMFISKKNLDSEKIRDFILKVKLTAINRLAEKMKGKAYDILQKANKEAYKRLKNITIQDFDYIVCKAANDEGTWEPDMLFRVYNTYHRKEAEQLALKDEELHNISTEIRKASQLQPCLEPESRNVIKYENEERYLTGEYLNSNHLPIELGDIFYNGNSKYFILLSQPCDLMMRIENGKIGRSYNLNDALLFEIVNKPNNIDPFCTPELKYWKYKTNKNYFLNFRKKHIIKLCILDLCVFNRDGKSVFDSELNCPERVIPLWQLYYSKHIKKNLKKIASFYKKIGNKTFKLSDTEKSLIRTYTIYPFQIDYQNKKGENFTIKFNCQRVGRLQRNRAEAILSQYSFHMSRAAFERDLGKKMS